MSTARAAAAAAAAVSSPPPAMPPPLVVRKKETRQSVDNPITLFSALTTYFSYAVLIAFGRLRDLFGSLTGRSRYLVSAPQRGYAPLLQSWENFFTRRMFHRIQDCWNRPITGAPAAHINLLQRTSDDGQCTMRLVPDAPPRRVLNLGSYNYLGFADDWRETCREQVFASMERHSISSGGARCDNGTTDIHADLEAEVARFVGKEDAVVFTMGYGTNSLSVPALMGKGTLIISDALNHTSIVNGARASGAVVKVFNHNNAENLERVLRESIVEGRPRTHLPWKKILVMIEGVYSMEGEMCDLPAIVRVAKKYKAYIYLDEAHSIGAVGRTGRGVCEHWGVSTSEIDVMMGTFTKSFGAMGGYIAGSREFVQYLRQNSAGCVHSNAMSPIVAAQVLRALRVMETPVGLAKIRRLVDNADYFRQRLIDMGCEVFGDWGSPIIPVLIYNPAKVSAFSHEAAARGIAVVVVGFPATPLVLSRCRFCISAGHTREDLDKALATIDDIVGRLKLRYRRSTFG